MSDAVATTEKAANYGARAGQTIAGRLVRGGDGQFASSGAAVPTYRKPKGTSRSIIVKRRDAKAKGGKKATAKKPAAGKAPKSASAVEREQLALQTARERLADIKTRRAERAADRAQRASDRAKAGVEKVGQQAQTAAQTAKRTADRKAEIERRREEKQAQGKGGGGGGKAKPQDKDAAKAAERAKNRSAVQAATLDAPAFDAFASLAEGGDADPAQVDALVETGLVERDTTGGVRVSAAGRSYLVAANSGDVGRAKDAMSRAVDRVAARAKRKEAPAFAVYKDARTGKGRWLTVSSTAFQDRDGEIVSVEALNADCDRADADGQYGPLRWWHLPGVDIGDCDFNMVVGKSLIESGTFRDERIGAILAQKAADHQISIGFLHPRNQPDADGVFTRIRRFERSLTPAGRASNPFTRLVVKDTDMTTPDDKIAAFKALFGDDPTLVGAFMSATAATEKSAEAAGVTFKESAVLQTGEREYSFTVTARNPEDADRRLKEMALVGTTVKAEGDAPPADESMPEEAAVAEDEAESLFSAAELQGLATALAPLLVAAMSGVATKASGEIAAVKDEVAAVKAQAVDLDATVAAVVKSAATLQAKQAELAAAEATLNARLKELESDQPQGYRRPSQAPDNILTDEQIAQKQYTTPGKTALDTQVDFILNPSA